MMQKGLFYYAQGSRQLAGDVHAAGLGDVVTDTDRDAGVTEDLHNLGQLVTEDGAVRHVVPVVLIEDRQDLGAFLGLVTDDLLDDDLGAVLDRLQAVASRNGVTVELLARQLCVLRISDLDHSTASFLLGEGRAPCCN